MHSCKLKAEHSQINESLSKEHSTFLVGHNNFNVTQGHTDSGRDTLMTTINHGAPSTHEHTKKEKISFILTPNPQKEGKIKQHFEYFANEEAHSLIQYKQKLEEEIQELSNQNLNRQ